MITLSGIPVSPGIAIGKIHLVNHDKYIVRDYILKSQEEVDSELAHFFEAINRTCDELGSIITRIDLKNTPQTQIIDPAIFESQKILVKDPTVLDAVEKSIKTEKMNAAFAFKKIMEKHIAQFSAIQDQYMKDRAIDLIDVYNRVIKHLVEDYVSGFDSLKIDEPIIILAYTLTPSEIVNLERQKILGIGIELGGKTSHSSIIARSLEIPTTVGIGDLYLTAKTGDIAVVDGTKGKIILHPDQRTLNKYRILQKRFLNHENKLFLLKNLNSVTLDGKYIDIAANIELPIEINTVVNHGCKSIGLCRTEFLFMMRKTLPTEEEQYCIYRDYVKTMTEGYVIIRTLDIGSDKMVDLIDMPVENNPFLGWRAVRMSLDMIDLFTTQLRAILRASIHGNLKIMFPMISSLEELRKVLKVYRDVKRNLFKENIPFTDNIEVGIMIEVPSAVILADELAKEVDFFSIGTNDLIQFTLAVDRSNEHLANLFDPLSPAILRSIKNIVSVAHKNGKWVGVCGEMASDPIAALLLLGMNVDELSMNPSSVLEIKKIFRNVTFDDIFILTKKALKLNSSKKIKSFLTKNTGNLLKNLSV